MRSTEKIQESNDGLIDIDDVRSKRPIGHSRSFLVLIHEDSAKNSLQLQN